MIGVVVIYVGAAWLLIQVAESDAVQDMFRVDAQLVLLAAIVGFPLAIVAGWFYDIRKYGIFRTPPVDADPTYDPTLSARDGAFLSALFIVWAIAVYVVYIPPPVDKSIALLPFEVRGNDPDSEVFASGVREDLHGHLGRIRVFRVPELNAANDVDVSHPIDRIGRQLDVAYVLKATVERIADRIHLNVSLIESNTSTTVWWQPYDRELSTRALFDIRKDIVTSIASNLRAELSEQEIQGLNEQHTANLAAWEAYARGKEQLRKRTGDAIMVAVREFEHAVTLDPDFALAHAELAIALVLSEDYAGAQVDDATVRFHAQMASVLDPGLPQSHAAMRFTGDGNGLQHLQRAIEINPSYADAHAWLSYELRFSGDPEGAFLAAREAARLDPTSVPANYLYIEELIKRREQVEAEEQIERLAVYCDWCARHLRGMLASLDGNWAEIILADLRVRSMNRDGPRPWSVMDDLPWQLAMVGLESEALRMAFPENEQLLLVLSWEEAAAWIQENFPEKPKWGLHSTVYIWTYIGEYALAHAAVEEMLQNRDVGDRFRELKIADTFKADCFVAVLHAMGDEARADEIIAELLDNARGFRAAGVEAALWEESVDYQEGVALYLSGERERGSKLIARAVIDGFWMPPPGKFQKAMYQEPEIRKALQIQADRQAREREKLLNVVCDNNNPYRSVWRPMPDTCESHLTASQNP